MAGGADQEVRTRFTFDDQVSGNLDDIEGKVEDVEVQERKANETFKEWAETAAHVAQTIGVNLRDVVGKVQDVGMSFVVAGADAESGDQAIAALIKTAQGKGFDDARDQAEGLGDAIDEIAISAGISGDAVGAAFQSILEKTGSTEQGIERAVGELDKMAIIAGQLDKDVGAVANEFSFMQEGVLKTKGQLFQLLQSTGIFGNDSKKAVEAWSKLTEEKRIELLSYGMNKLAGSMRDMPPTFKQATAGFENMVRISKEAIGRPLLEELTPALDDVTKMLVEMQPEIAEFARAMSKEVATGVREGGKALKEAIGWLRDHKDEIAQGFKEGAEKVKEVITFLLDHKEEIAIALGVKMAAPAVGAARGAANAGIGAANTWIKANISGLSDIERVGKSAAISLGATAVALAAVALAADQAVKLTREYEDATDTRIGGMKKLVDLANKGDVENVENTVKTMRALDLAAGTLDDKMRRFYDGVIESAQRNADAKGESTAALARQIAISKAAIESTYAQSLGDTSTAGQAWAQQMTQNQVAALTFTYNQAAKAGDTAMMQLAAQTIASSGMVSEAFLKASTDIEGGFGAMADVLVASGAGFGNFVSQLRGKGGAATPKAPQLNLNGGQTFNIKQDFRQADPDRVAIQFRRDIGRMAGRKVQSAFTGPFGG